MSWTGSAGSARARGSPYVQANETPRLPGSAIASVCCKATCCAGRTSPAVRSPWPSRAPPSAISSARCVRARLSTSRRRTWNSRSSGRSSTRSKDFLEFAVPYGSGEPLLNPEIYDMIAYCRSAGVPTGISTNATVLTEAASRRLIAGGARLHHLRLRRRHAGDLREVSQGRRF